jgi:putative heme-binding domain-containing protein
MPLKQWLSDEYDSDAVERILESLIEHPADEVRGDLAAVVRSREYADGNRLTALRGFARGLEKSKASLLLELAATIEDGAVLAELLRLTARNTTELPQDRPAPQELAGPLAPLLLEKLSSAAPDVRAAAVDAAADLGLSQAGSRLGELLADDDARVRRAAAVAVQKIKLPSAADQLLNLTRDPDGPVRSAAIDSLRRLGDRRILPIAIHALTDRATEQAALECIAEFGGPEQASVLTTFAKRALSQDALLRTVQLLTAWADKTLPSSSLRSELNDAVAELQGATGVLVRWNASGPVSAEEASRWIDQFANTRSSRVSTFNAPPRWRTLIAAGPDARASLASSPESTEGTRLLACTDVTVPTQTPVQLIGSASGGLRVWLNGQSIYQRDPAPFQVDSDRFNATLEPGANRLLIQMTAPQGGAAEFHLRFRSMGSSRDRELFIQQALTRKGDATRGRQVFLNADKSLCIKCHRMGDWGERIGPDLTAVGARFSRIHLIESMLEPSRTIAPSFDSVAVALKDGRVLTGIKLSETDRQLTVADSQAQKHTLVKDDIEEYRSQLQSIMPDGIEQRLTANEFLDLLEFLLSQR